MPAGRQPSRREAIVEAAIPVVGRRGYREATVGEIIAEASVARTTFYKHFAGKPECFLAALELVAQRVRATVEEGCDVVEDGGELPWVERVRAGLVALVELLAAEPELARVAVVEPVVAGAEARRHQLETIERCAQMLEGKRDSAADRPSFDKLATGVGPMAVGAVTGLLFDEIQAGQTTDLPRRLPDLLFALLVPYIGPREAAEEASRSSVAPR